jgi:hypothetical protein
MSSLKHHNFIEEWHTSARAKAIHKHFVNESFYHKIEVLTAFSLVVERIRVWWGNFVGCTNSSVTREPPYG